jgi:hypothetical protein
MDMRKYAGSSFLKVEDVRDSTRRDEIVDVTMGDFDKPVLHLASGDKLSLNATNTKALNRAFGWDSASWAGKTIELYIGQVEFKGQEQDSVLVRSISPPVSPDAGKGDMGEEIPY